MLKRRSSKPLEDERPTSLHRSTHSTDVSDEIDHASVLCYFTGDSSLPSELVGLLVAGLDAPSALMLRSTCTYWYTKLDFKVEVFGYLSRWEGLPVFQNFFPDILEDEFTTWLEHSEEIKQLHSKEKPDLHYSVDKSKFFFSPFPDDMLRFKMISSHDFEPPRVTPISKYFKIDTSSPGVLRHEKKRLAVGRYESHPVGPKAGYKWMTSYKHIFPDGGNIYQVVYFDLPTVQWPKNGQVSKWTLGHVIYHTVFTPSNAVLHSSNPDVEDPFDFTQPSQYTSDNVMVEVRNVHVRLFRVLNTSFGNHEFPNTVKDSSSSSDSAEASDDWGYFPGSPGLFF